MLIFSCPGKVRVKEQGCTGSKTEDIFSFRCNLAVIERYLDRVERAAGRSFSDTPEWISRDNLEMFESQ
jgi:hypothetical protein